MNENYESVSDELDYIWLNSPAFMIDWLREHIDDIEKHIKDCNQFINKMIDMIK